MATSLSHAITATASTTDGNITTCGNYTLADETVIIAMAYVVGRTTAGVAATYIRTMGVQREGGAGAAAVGVVDATGWFHTGEDAGAALWDCTMDVNTNDVRVRVTGAAATTVNWRTKLYVELLTP